MYAFINPYMNRFFVVMVWLVPMTIFMTICLNDNVLPGALGINSDSSQNGLDNLGEGGAEGGRKKSLFRMVVDSCYLPLKPILIMIQKSLNLIGQQLQSKKGL
jgi:hypothetical protein